MSLQTHNGKLLVIGGKIAASTNCCNCECAGPFDTTITINCSTNCLYNTFNGNEITYNAGANPGIYRICYISGWSKTSPDDEWLYNQLVNYYGIDIFIAKYWVGDDETLVDGGNAPGSWNFNTDGYTTGAAAEAASIGNYIDVDCTSAAGNVIIKMWLNDNVCNDNSGTIVYGIKKL
jgi:hypothetical protein